MNRIRITHKTEYHYNTPVILGAHRALVRPREGHDVHIESSVLKLNHKPGGIAIFTETQSPCSTLPNPGTELSLFSQIVVAHYVENPFDFIIDPNASSYPFQHPAYEQTELIPYCLSSYPQEGDVMRLWLSHLYSPGQLRNTLELLQALNTHVYRSFRYVRREETRRAVSRRGSCRDYVVLLTEAARHLGFGARFVTGYIQMNDHQHGRMLGHGFTFRARAGSGLIPRTVCSLGPNMFPLPLRVMRREPHP